MNNELMIRQGFFWGTLVIVGIWELLWPKRQLSVSKTVRWYSNLGIILLDSLLIRWLFPLLAVGMAALAVEKQWGLLNNIDIPYELAVVLSVIVLDMIIYLQHLMFHAVPRLWLLHRMHHSDRDYDVTTGLRFHPIEIAMSMVIKLAAVVAIGPPVMAVLIFEVVLNASAMFNHGNIRLPAGVDRILRLFIVTPDMHRVHHSEIKSETDSNYGFFLSWWDLLYGTYTAQPQEGHEGMTIGIELFKNPIYSHLHWMLIQPFINRK